jgi:hypothetical protein
MNTNKRCALAECVNYICQLKPEEFDKIEYLFTDDAKGRIKSSFRD